VHSEIHRLNNSVWNKEELSHLCSKFTTAPIYKNGEKMECSNYRQISLLATTYRIASSARLLMLNKHQAMKTYVGVEV